MVQSAPAPTAATTAPAPTASNTAAATAPAAAPGAAAAPPLPELIRVKVAKAGFDAEDIRVLELWAEDGQALPLFTPGAHIDIEVMLPGRHRARRSYSIVNPPTDPIFHYTVAIQYEQDGDGGSIFLHEKVRPSYILEATPPKNFFEMAPDAEHSVFLAGGIGVTPLLCMAQKLVEENKSFEFHYVGKRPERMAFKNIVQGFGDKGRLYFSQNDKTRGGFDARALMGPPSPNRHVYVCGPTHMIEEVRQIGHELGWDEKNVHTEIFKKPEPRPGDGPVEVVIASTGKTVQVPAKQSILDALLAAGVKQDYDCRVGTCGTCAVTVVEGEADHRDNVLLEAEKVAGRMCTCVSRSKAPRLVIDL